MVLFDNLTQKSGIKVQENITVLIADHFETAVDDRHPIIHVIVYPKPIPRATFAKWSFQSF